MNFSKAFNISAGLREIRRKKSVENRNLAAMFVQSEPVVVNGTPMSGRIEKPARSGIIDIEGPVFAVSLVTAFSATFAIGLPFP